MLAEQHDEWIESRRYLGPDLIQQSQADGTMSASETEQEDANTDLALGA